VHVRAPQEKAFRLFTEQIGGWWPMESHSVFGATATVAMEHGVVVETSATGERTVWAEVTLSEPPNRWSLRWHPGTDPERPTTVDVTFVADDEGTRVIVTHTGWEALGERAQEARRSYDDGWVPVLERLAEAIG